MKKALSIIGLFFASVVSVHGQIAQTVASSASTQTITPKAVGDTFLVECDYNGVPPTSVAISDSIGTVYTSVGVADTSNGPSQFVSISNPLPTAVSRVVTCPAPASGSTFGEIYIVELTGAMSVEAEAQANGAKSPAQVTLQATSGDVLVAFCITGTCTLPSGWTALSALDDNLVAWNKSTSSSVSASFSVTSNWVLTAVSLKPTVVAAASLPITLAINSASPNLSSLTFDDGTVVYVGAIVPEQWNGSTWVSAGSVASDANGKLTGTFTINPQYADANGNISLQFALPGIANMGQQTMPLSKFQQGSTGFTVKEVLFKSLFLKQLLAVEKSSSVTLTP
jgi:hypothetical protein